MSYAMLSKAGSLDVFELRSMLDALVELMAETDSHDVRRGLYRQSWELIEQLMLAVAKHASGREFVEYRGHCACGDLKYMFEASSKPPVLCATCSQLLDWEKL